MLGIIVLGLFLSLIVYHWQFALHTLSLPKSVGRLSYSIPPCTIIPFLLGAMSLLPFAKCGGNLEGVQTELDAHIGLRCVHCARKLRRFSELDRIILVRQLPMRINGGSNCCYPRNEWLDWEFLWLGPRWPVPLEIAVVVMA